MAEKTCMTCRWWNAHSRDERLGDCMSDHRYWRVHKSQHRPGVGVALMDSFGREETKPTDRCGKHERGSDLPPFEAPPPGSETTCKGKDCPRKGE